jgi:hypothetical protein
MKLSEIFQSDNRQEHDYQSAILIIVKNCSQAAHAIVDDNKLLFRQFQDAGLKNHTNEFVHLDGSMSGRISRNTENYYTLIMDNAPEWKEYPKRNASYICTTNYIRALTRGAPATSYIIIPYDGVKIAKCPDYDIWDSFGSLYKYGITSMMDFGEFLNSLNRDILKELGDDMWSNYDQDDWDVFQSEIKKTNEALQKIDNLDNFRSTSRDFLNLVKTRYDGDILIALEALMAPDKNGFSFGSYSSMIPKYTSAGNGLSGYECWFSGPAMIVGFDPRSGNFESFKEDLHEALQGFHAQKSYATVT